jgi:predicted TPR repeat methyltransferase
MPVRLPTFVSSGDLIADRRFDYAMGLKADGDPAAAADLLVDVLDLVPGWATAWHALGEVRETQGDRTGAIDAYGRAAAADPEDRHGARLKLVRLGVAPAEGAMSAGYVRAVFDEYAPRFDKALVDDLGYSAPALLRAALDHTAPGRRFDHALDLGCGTGLAGRAMAGLCDSLDGVDLSPRMIAYARSTGCYRNLAVAEMVSALAERPAGSLDLVIAADAFVYLADLSPVLAAASRALAPGGLAAFTVETWEGDGIDLGEALRFRHGRAHVRAALDAAGLTVRVLDAVSTRQEAGQPVACLMVVACR